jgi:hypothetical protein
MDLWRTRDSPRYPGSGVRGPARRSSILTSCRAAIPRSWCTAAPNRRDASALVHRWCRPGRFLFWRPAFPARLSDPTVSPVLTASRRPVIQKSSRAMTGAGRVPRSPALHSRQRSPETEARGYAQQHRGLLLVSRFVRRALRALGFGARPPRRSARAPPSGRAMR